MNAVLVDAAADRPQAGLTAGEYLRDWVDRQPHLVRESTSHAYRLAVRRIDAGLGSVPLNELSVADVGRLEADLVKGGGSGGGPLSRRTVANIHSVFFQAMEIAVRDGHCASNPVAQVSPPRRSWCWPRRGCGAVRCSACDGATSISTRAGCRSPRRSPKSPARRSSPSQRPPRLGGGSISTGTLAALRAHREAADPDAVFVFESVDGGPVNPRSFSHTFDRLVDGAGVRRIRLHDVRHTDASLALRNGMYPVELSERLGHTSVSITMNVYAHLIPTSDRRHLDVIPDLIFSHVPPNDP